LPEPLRINVPLPLPAPKLDNTFLLRLGRSRHAHSSAPREYAGRRWPVISIALIAINAVAFLATHGQIEAQATKQSETRVRILMLAAMHRDAVEEYDKLARAYPTERQSLLALIAAARLSLKKLNRPAEALRFYTEAAASPVPHLDWTMNIEAGIQEAQKSLASGEAPAAKD